MRIAVDASSAIRQLGGVSEYTYQLLKGLGSLKTEHEFLITTIGRNRRAMGELPDLPNNFRHYPVQYPYRLLQWGWRYLNFPKINRWLPPFDVFFAPHFLLPAGDYKKLVVAVHDVIFLDHPEWFLESDVSFFTQSLKKTLARANQVITVSEASKAAIVAKALISADRIKFVPPGVDFIPPTGDELARVKKLYNLPDSYLLFLGTLEPRKNILRILDAYRMLADSGLKFPLILAGRRGWLGQELEDKLASLNLGEKVRLLGNFDRVDRPALLAGARALVFPSLAEGFGLPVVEAMAAGVPVLTSNISSLPEAAGDAAILVDPYDVAAIAGGIEQICDDANLARDLSRRGLERAKGYTWKNTAEATLKIMEEI